MAAKHDDRYFNMKILAKTQKAPRQFLRCVMCLVMMLMSAGCNSRHKPMEPLPPGMAYLKQAPAGRDYEAFIIEATVESERFRRRLLSGDDPDFIHADLLAKAIMAFRRQAPRYLTEHKAIDGFDLSEQMINKAVSGAGRIASRRAYGGFKGKWYGLWDTMKVDHHWSEIVKPDRPREVEMTGERPVWIRSYQYCWVGDGYGLNMIATEDPRSQSGDFLLGYVVHVEQGDMARPTKRRPHVGLFIGEGKLIWITAGEVFLEETYEVSPGVQAYAITGFSYKVAENTLKTTKCFQAVYTRKPDHRPDWFSFPLELRVSR